MECRSGEQSGPIQHINRCDTNGVRNRKDTNLVAELRLEPKRVLLQNTKEIRTQGKTRENLTEQWKVSLKIWMAQGIRLELEQ